jgi:2,3-bisphosphoglycerate-dependent phosphoglycerate mutase
MLKEADTMKTQLYIVRHGAYVESETTGRGNPILSSEGIDQAERLRDRLATGDLPVDVLIASTLHRAQQTAEIIAPALDLPILSEPDVEEWRNEDGTRPFDEFITELLEAGRESMVFVEPYAGGETLAQFWFRATNALARIAREHNGKRVMVVCHGGIIEASFLLFGHHSTLFPPPFALSPDYTSITLWKRIPSLVSDEAWQLDRYNDTMHLHHRYSATAGGTVAAGD